MTVAASAVLVPVMLSWLWRVSNDRWVLLGAVVLVNLVLVLAGRASRSSEPAHPNEVRGRTRLLLTCLIGWMAGCVFLSFWLPSAAGNVTVTRAHDYIKHHAVMLSLERHPLPLHNCFYAAEADTPYYYYEHYYLLPAALRTLTGNRVSIPLAFGLTSAMLAGIMIMLTFILARQILGSDRCALLSAVFVSLAGGLDVIPVLIKAACGSQMVVTLDAWCPVAWRIHNFATQYFWCPQHVFAVAGLTLAALWLRQAPGQPWWVLMAPLLAASILGGSAHLAIVIFPAAAAYVIHRILRTAAADRARLGRLLKGVAVLCLLGLLLMLRQAWGYHEMSGRYAGGLTCSWERFPFAAAGRLLPPGPPANWADAPWLLVVELGLPALACVLVTRRFWAGLWADPGMRLFILAGLSGAVLVFTFRSDVNSIDYGFRISPMAVAPLLAICAGALLNADAVRPPLRKLCGVLVVLGVVIGLPIGLYEAPTTALRSVWESRRLASEVGAIAYLRNETAQNTVVQGDPERRLDLTALTDRQAGVENPISAHVVVFAPRDPDRMRQAYSEVKEAFTAASASLAYEKLHKWGVQYVLAGLLERASFGLMPQFADSLWFEEVYNNGHAAVYRLRQAPSAGRPASASQESRP